MWVLSEFICIYQNQPPFVHSYRLKITSYSGIHFRCCEAENDQIWLARYEGTNLADNESMGLFFSIAFLCPWYGLNQSSTTTNYYYCRCLNSILIPIINDLTATVAFLGTGLLDINIFKCMRRKSLTCPHEDIDFILHTP